MQLEAYALAVDEAGLAGGRRPDGIRVTFAYCGGDDVEEITEDVGADWLGGARIHLSELLTAARGMGLARHDFAIVYEALARMAGRDGAGA